MKSNILFMFLQILFIFTIIINCVSAAVKKNILSPPFVSKLLLKQFYYNYHYLNKQSTYIFIFVFTILKSNFFSIFNVERLQYYFNLFGVKILLFYQLFEYTRYTYIQVSVRMLIQVILTKISGNTKQVQKHVLIL